LDVKGGTIWVVDAHRDEKRFVVRADDASNRFENLHEKLSDAVISPIA